MIEQIQEQACSRAEVLKRREIQNVVQSGVEGLVEELGEESSRSGLKRLSFVLTAVPPEGTANQALQLSRAKTWG